jgi:hypothetical protein
MAHFLARAKQRAEDIRREIAAEKDSRKLDRAGEFEHARTYGCS